MPNKSDWYGEEIVDVDAVNSWKAIITPPDKATDNTSERIANIETWLETEDMASNTALSDILVSILRDINKLPRATSKVITGRHNTNK